MSSYLLDVICSATNHFIGMGWDWNPTIFPIHVYYFQLWEDSYRRNFYDICEYFLVPLYVMIYKQKPLRISTKAMKYIKDIGDWYIGRYFTYIRVYGCASATHLLPRYIPDKLMIREISYQTVDARIMKLLASNSKRYWPKFPIIVGTHTLLNVSCAKKEEKYIKVFILCMGKDGQHDPKGTIQSHLKLVWLVSPNQHQLDPEEEIFRGYLSFEEVLLRIRNEVGKEAIKLLEETKGK
jgi:hypothetical protein